jgi:hypothetical protein
VLDGERGLGELIVRWSLVMRMLHQLLMQFVQQGKVRSLQTRKKEKISMNKRQI